jgi:ribosomal small subunit protein bTHX
MGKGDRKTRRGKLYRGSFGKSRPKDPRKHRKGTARGRRR